MGIWRGIRRLWSEPGDVLTVLILVLLVGIPLLLAAVPEAVHAPHPSLLPSINARPWLWPAIEPRDKLVYGLFVLAAMLVVVIGRRSGQSNHETSGYWRRAAGADRGQRPTNIGTGQKLFQLFFAQRLAIQLSDHCFWQAVADHNIHHPFVLAKLRVEPFLKV